MRSFARVLAALLLLFVLGSGGTSPARGGVSVAAAPGEEIAYTVTMPQPQTHLLEIEMRGRGTGSADHVDLVLPAWTPGSYELRDFARHVQDFAVTDPAGRPLPWEKIRKDTWRVRTAKAGEAWRVTYRVYAHKTTQEIADQATLTDRFAFWNNAAALMSVDGRLKTPATLRVAAPTGWKVATGLPPVAGAPDTFRAPDFDVLYDSPVLVGPFQTLTFTVQGVPHRIVLQGDGNYDTARLQKDLQKIVETATALMGDIPYRDYTFLLVMIGGNEYLGLEHANSTAIAYPRWLFSREADYRYFLRLAAHEFFHTWNVKRMRPDVLGPFDYTRENPTRLLWVAEGLTRYYENRLLRRAGLLSDTDYLQILSTAIENLRYVPGRHQRSVEEASFDVWVRKSPENAPNTTVDYYEKGGILGAFLDLEIRGRSGGAQSLDDVMRTMNVDFARKGRNYTSADFQKACERAAGGSLEAWFARQVRGRDEIDYDTALAVAGLRLDTTGGAAVPAQIAYLGAYLAEEAGRLKVVSVQKDSPAEARGLSAGDELLALDGRRISPRGFYDRMDEKHPGDTIRLTVFRGDDLRTFDITLVGITAAEYRIVPVPQPDAAQKKRYQEWLEMPHPQADAKKS